MSIVPRSATNAGKGTWQTIRQAVRAKPCRANTRVTWSMKDLSDWILTTAAVAVRLMPGLAILAARSLARLVYRVLGPRPEGEGRLGVEPPHGDPAGFPATRG